MPINKTGDTRDLVIELATRFEMLEKRVSKNSDILDRLDSYVTQAKGASRVGRVMLDSGKLLFAGGAGAGIWTWAQSHLPRLVIAMALVIGLPRSAAAAVDGAEGWIFVVEACRETCHEVARRDLGGAWRCAQATAALAAVVPGTTPEAWGFPEGPAVTVRSRCITGTGA
jgi:hypothetical protein